MKLTTVARQGIKAALWMAGRHQSIAQGDTAFLIYHSVSGRLSIELDLAPAVFERQLAYLAVQASVIDFERAIAQLTNGQQGQPKRYVLTFDDGYRDFYTTVFPLLQRWQLPAILYVNSGFVEEGVAYPMLTYPHLPVEPVTWAMLGEMVASGLVTLGAHTHTHPRLTECNAAQIEEELARPIELFRRELGIIPQHFCYPQARWNPTVEQLVQKQYRTAVIGTGTWATANGFNPYRIPRLPIRRSDNWLYFQAKVKRKMANEEAFYARLGRLRGGHGFSGNPLAGALGQRHAHAPTNERNVVGVTIKIAHITTIDLSLRYLLLNQLRSLQAAGYQVTGISSSGRDVSTLEAAGIRHIAVPMTRNFTPGADLKALARLVHILRRERFTIVHTHTPKPGLLGQLAARIAGVPIVVNTLHGFYFHEGMKPFWRNFYIQTEKLAARCSDLILSQNAEDIATANREGIGHTDRIKYLGNGIDLRRFDRRRIAASTLATLRCELQLDPKRPVVGFVGRLVAEKGIHELLQAAQQVLAVAPETHFLIVGPIDQEKRDAITPAIAADYGMASAFTFTGMRQDMPEIYALMDLFVLPSHREGFPRSPMEASAMGVPAIVTDIRGCREAVEDGRNGLLVPLGDHQALAAAILRLLQQPGEAQALGLGGRHLAEERFDEEFVFTRVKTEYSRLLIEKGLLDSRTAERPMGALNEVKFPSNPS